jgi:hypothetical protein
MPVEEGATIQWQTKSLRITGVWEGLDPPFEATIYDSSEGSVNWRCLHPRARATIQLGRGRVLEGFGYVERLEMTLAPWKLPLQELRWGRFLSDSASLVWIDWKGTHSRRIVLRNGLLESASVINESNVALNGNGDLRLVTGDVLRNGALGETALAIIPGLKRLFPKKFLSVRECKWLSRAELRLGDSISSGWAIHEVVKWPE